MPDCRVHIRWMIRRDMPEVMEIERATFKFPWTEEDFFRCLRQRNCIGMVAEHGERVVGFMVYELMKTRIHLLNLAVHPRRLRQRIGRQLVGKLCRKLSADGRSSITLEVRETNLPAQRFFAAVGFLATGVYRRFYEECDEDAYRFIYRHGWPRGPAPKRGRE